MARRLAVALGALLLVVLALEVFLRVAERAPPPLFARADGRVRLAPGRENFVPLDVAELPVRPRLVWMGASTVVGVPYEPVLSPPRWLALVLAHRGVDAEVLSVAAPGLAAADLARLVPEVLELRPAALIVATGHNEYLSATQILGRRWWHGLRTAALVEQVLARGARPEELLPTPARGFDHTAVTEAYAESLRTMQRLADESGVPLLLCTEVSNLADMPPVLGDDPTAAQDADAAWAEGRARLAEGDRAGALAALERARDLDLWPHRAPGALNAAVRAEARHTVELDRLFVEASAAGVPGFDLFADHCHPDPGGQRLMAIGVADALEESGVFPPTGRRGEGPSLEDGLGALGADARMHARAGAQVGRAFTGFALMRGTPGELAVLARRILEEAREASGGRAGEVFGSLALLDLLEGDPAAAREHVEACRTASRDAVAILQRLHDHYPWVTAVFVRNGLELREGRLRALQP